MWKISNISKPAQDIKVAAAKNNTTTVGVILQPNHFCVVDGRMTSSMDAQEKRGFISIDRVYENDLQLNLCESYSNSYLGEARKQAVDYKG
jgi:hypothetical protein